MRRLRTFDEIEEEYFLQHPEEIDEYVSVIFDEYAQDRDLGALLASLRIVSRVKGVTSTAEAAGMTRKGLQKALSDSGNPKFESLVSIMGAMGYRLLPRKVEMTTAD